MYFGAAAAGERSPSPRRRRQLRPFANRDSAADCLAEGPALSPSRLQVNRPQQHSTLVGAACGYDAPPPYGGAALRPERKLWRRPAPVELAQLRTTAEWASPVRASHRREKGAGRYWTPDNLPRMLAQSSTDLPPTPAAPCPVPRAAAPAAQRSRSAPPAPPSPESRRWTHTTRSSLHAAECVLVGAPPAPHRRGRGAGACELTSASQTFAVGAQQIATGRSASPRSHSALPSPWCRGDGAPPSPRCRPTARGVTGRRKWALRDRSGEETRFALQGRASPSGLSHRRQGHLESCAVQRALSGRAPSESPRRGKMPAGPTLRPSSQDVVRPETHAVPSEVRRKGRGSPKASHFHITRLW